MSIDDKRVCPNVVGCITPEGDVSRGTDAQRFVETSAEICTRGEGRSVAYVIWAGESGPNLSGETPVNGGVPREVEEGTSQPRSHRVPTCSISAPHSRHT